MKINKQNAEHYIYGENWGGWYLVNKVFGGSYDFSQFLFGRIKGKI